MRKFIVLALAALLLGSMAITTTTAEAGGRGGGKPPKGGGGGVTATVAGDPNPAAAYSYIRIKGCGYASTTPVEVRIEHATTEAFMAWVYADGCIDMGFWTSEAGTYGLKGLQSSVLKATGSLIVQ